MNKVREFIDVFVTKDYFIIFLAIMIMILIVLLIAIIKIKTQYKEEYVSSWDKDNDLLDNLKSETVTEELPPIDRKLELDIEKETYASIIDDYEGNEEENAVISTEELERKTQERMDTLGITDNQAMIDKYEEEQEKKAIISYEQLLKNASNITITYKEESTPEGAPKVNKIELQQKDVTESQCYVEEEEFLRILKEFRTSLPGGERSG